MKKKTPVLVVLVALILSFGAPAFATTIKSGSNSGSPATTGNTVSNSSSQPCQGNKDFFGLPKWYAYLPGRIDPTTHQCSPAINSISDVWKIVAAVIEMLLRVAGIGAVFMIIYGGIRYTTSAGSPEAVTEAKNTIIYSVIGLVLAVSAAFLVTFIAGSLGA